MWNLLGPRPVNMLVWDSFSSDWANDIQSQLKLENVHICKVDYGKLPDLNNNQFKGDIVFNWNGTSSGVCVPDGEWISKDRKGLTFCDATSAVFAMKMDFEKLDVIHLFTIAFGSRNLICTDVQANHFATGPHSQSHFLE